MSEQTPAVIDDLDSFSADFFGQKDAHEPASSEVSEVKVDDAIEPVQLDGNDTPVDGSDSAEDVEKLQEEALKPKKNRFQERIDELTGKQRDAERRAADLEQKLQDAIDKLNKTPEPKVPTPNTNGPSADDLDDTGEAKYPLGEYDPKFIRDLTRHEVAEAQKTALEEEAQRVSNQKEEALQQARQASWNEKLVPAKERYPDFVEKGAELIASLETKIDPGLNKYLTDRIMEMDHGEDVFYYLANNPEEAHAIVAKGAIKATIALGHIEAKFIQAEAEKKLARPKVSNAPTPPPTNKGNTGAHVEVPGDTDDLDAFASEFFKKRR